MQHTLKQAIYTSLLTMGAICSNPAHAAPVELESDFFCFASAGARPVRLELQRYWVRDSDVQGAYVKYGKLRPAIYLFESGSKDMKDGGRQASVETTWLEMGKQGVNGKYVMETQGAVVNAFSYINGKSGKKMEFRQTYERNANNTGCQW